MLTKEQVLKIAHLARLKLTEAEVEKYQGQLSQILDYVAMLDEVDVSKVEPTAQVTGLTNSMRPDEAKVSFGQSVSIREAAATQKGYFKVKAVL